jgi:asparagine synthase (glutamine-hydrolysing)
MCGICGIISLAGSQSAQRPLLQQMCQILTHRGPDDDGIYQDQKALLGMRRLSIIDLVTGQQPVSNEDGTLWLVFNGEIYNYRDLRAQLVKAGHHFTTQSDSEVIVHAYEAYGPQCLDRFNGMFAFAIWDTTRQQLFLARDRLGIKPLYYWAQGEQLVFGSELSALLCHPDVPREIDRLALDQFLTVEYIPAPRTILHNVHKLLPGHWLRFDAQGVRLEQYWDVPVRPFSGSQADAIAALSELIDDAVRLRLVSDVPVGAFLSGGIDSSTIVASMSRAMSQPVRTFSIGFGEASYNELPYARLVAAQFGTSHQEEILAPDISDLAVKLTGHLDEPLADFSIFPTYLVSQVAGRSVKVVLSGDGGDELFGGYDTYLAQQADRYYRWLPALVRQQVMPAALNRIPPQPAKKGLINKAKRFVEGAALPAAWQHVRWMSFMTAADKAALYQPDLAQAVNGRSAPSFVEPYFQQAAGRDLLARQQYVDVKTYLADNILTKVDRMSMAASIEARVPLLDHRLVAFALNLPPHWKMRHGQTKLILRQAMNGRLPAAILDKPKQGFSIPLKHWLRGPLRPLLTDTLTESTITRRGLFQPQTIRRWLSEHLNGQANHSHRLWTLMVLELWQQKTGNG